MKKLSNLFYNRTSFIISLGATLLMVGYASFIMGGFSECFAIEEEGPSSLGLSLGYSFEIASQFFEYRDGESIQCYKNFIKVWDNIFPMVYSLMYILWISYLWKKVNQIYPKLWFINLYPLLMIIMDWAENFMEIQMVNYYMQNQ